DCRIYDRLCVGCEEPAEYERNIDERHEEVGGGNHGLLVVDPVDGRIIARLDTDQQTRKRLHRRHVREQLAQNSRRELAAASASVRQSGQTGFILCHAASPPSWFDSVRAETTRASWSAGRPARLNALPRPMATSAWLSLPRVFHTGGASTVTPAM